MPASPARSLVRIVAIAALLGSLATPAMAQVNTAIIDVIVTATDKTPLANVKVTVVNPERGFSMDADTGEAGTVTLAALQPGVYDIHFERDGYLPLTERAIALLVGQTVVVHATMLPRPTETITVAGGAPQVVDVRKTDSSMNVVPEQIEYLPVPDRDFQRLAFIAPTVQRERGEFRFISGGPVLGSGGNASQATILVDGVDLTDPALGLATTRFSQDAIREFRVISNRFDVEVGGSAGGALSIVTRSGTNSWTGTAFGFLRDDGLRARGALEQDKLSYSRHQFGGVLGGPLRRDRTHLFLSLEQIDEDNIVLFRPGGAYQSLAADVASPVAQTLAFGRADHRFNSRHRLAAKLSYERFRQDNFRVGGTQDVSYGQQLIRDNWVGNVEHSWLIGNGTVNQLHFQAGTRKYFEPRNSTGVAEWFSSGNTLRSGGNILGDLLGDGTVLELRNTFILQRDRHLLRAGVGVQRVHDRSRIEFYLSGLFIYVTDTRALPLAFAYGTGSADVTASTTRVAGYLQDDWGLRPDFKLSLGLRYDVDLNGNNPDFRHPLVPDGRDVDGNNLQPRAAFSWDVGGSGRHVVRGGAGLFTGRYLLTPVFQELQQNGVSGRLVQTRINGALLGLPSLALDPDHPTTTGIPQRPDISVMAPQLAAPSATQLSAGYTLRLGAMPIYLDVEGILIDGDDEIVIRDTNFDASSNPRRANPDFNQINTYTNDGRSRYTAMVLSLNGRLGRDHMVTASYTLAGKKNIADDFSPELPFGFPNDPARIEDEYGRARTDERHRIVMTGVFRMPFDVIAAPILEYGSGQPWTHRVGYDFNGDGRNSDRPAGVGRFTRDGPSFTQLSVRVTKALRLSGRRLDLLVEAFNLFNARNDNVATIDGAEFLSGPTITTPEAPFVRNTSFGRPTSTLPGREIQLGIRLVF